MKTPRPLIISLLLLALLLLPIGGSQASEPVFLTLSATIKAELDADAIALWQRINQARRNPMAEVQRLGLNLAQVRMVLGQDAWLLDQGLPPLALDPQLKAAAWAHGREMVDLVYYGHFSPAGLGPAARVSRAGYQALGSDETLAAMLMNKPIEKPVAIELIFDNILRDELLGTPGVARNVFSVDFTEMGLALLAENVTLLAGQPYVYLLVAEFGRPLVPRNFVIGQVDPGTTLALRNIGLGSWEFLPVITGGFFQYPITAAAEGEELYYWQNRGYDRIEIFSSKYLERDRNHHLDLRRLVSP